MSAPANCGFCHTLLIALWVITAPAIISSAQAQGVPPAGTSVLPSSQEPLHAAKPALDSYKLGTGDKVHIVVYGEDDLGGDFLVSDSGIVRLPLIGQVKAGGLSVRQFEDQIATKLVEQDILKAPKVSVEVETYRPFYIMGEVNKPGEYPYEFGMNVLDAVALAGGYTYRANDSEVFVRRNGGKAEEKHPADQTTKVNPGDIVRVGERFF